MRQFIQLVLVQYKDFFRQPGIVFWTLGFPILMAWGLGMAFSKQGEMIKHVAWVQEEKGSKLLEDFFQRNKVDKKANPNERITELGNKKAGPITYVFINTSWKEAELMVKRGKVSLILKESSDSLRYFFDPKNQEAQLAYLQVSSTINKHAGISANDSIHPFEQKGMRYVDFLVPGLLAMNIMMSCMWGISYTLIDKRTKKLLRRMVATPMNKGMFLISHLVSRLSLSFFEAFLLLFFSWIYFDISIQGSIPALILMITAGNIVFFGIATLVSSRTSNTQIGNGLINLVVMPMMICSGIFFSYHSFPDWLIPIIRLFPLTAMADGIRNIFIEGALLSDIFTKAIILCGTGMVFYFIGHKAYKWY